jgi:hypothetical protein
MAYIGGTYGDGAVTNLYTTAGRAGLDEGLQVVTGMSPDSLSEDWIRAVRATYGPLLAGRTPADEVGRRVLSADAGTGEVNVSPALSPDGRYVAFLSSKDLFSMNLYVADAETGRIVSRLRSSNLDTHFDAIRFINSSGTWSPDGRRFAFVTFAQGDNELAIWNVETGRIERRISVRGVSALAQPAWSPDGSAIAVSGMDGGISDLYLVELSSGRVRQLTDDRYGDLQPAWSPSGDRIAFVSDRGPGGTDFSTLDFGEPRLALLEVATGAIEPLRPFDGGLQHNPQFAPDGQGLYFISDHDGFKDVHHLDLASGRATPITRLRTGASGFTALSPAMTVAAQSGRMMFSVFSDNAYSVVSLEPATLAERQAEGPPTDAGADTGAAQAGTLPPWTGPGVVDQALARPTDGLPTDDYGAVNAYESRLRLDYIAPPALGVQVGGGFGARLGGSVGFYFSDMLGNHNLSLEALANGTLQDVGGQITYVNRARRFNYGLQVGHIPYLEQGGFTSIATDPATGLQTRRYRQIERRTFADQVSVLGAYPLRSTRRLEAQTGLTRYGFDYSVRDFYLYPNGVREDRSSFPSPDPVYLSQTATAYVVDFTNFGLVSPVQGGRYRLEVGATLGDAQYGTVLADARRYLRTGLVTVAGRLLHIGNYGAAEGDVFSSEYLGYSFTPSYVRGYSFNSIDPSECFGATDRCSLLDRLSGTRVATASLEVRMPLFGPREFGLFTFPYLPTELAAFTDAGLAWSAESPPALEWARDTDERVPVVSSGVSARINLFGAAIVEVFYAVPFQRPEKGGFVGLNLLPGW